METVGIKSDLKEFKLGMLYFMIDRTMRVNVPLAETYKYEIRRRLREGLIHEFEIRKEYGI